MGKCMWHTALYCGLLTGVDLHSSIRRNATAASEYVALHLCLGWKVLHVSLLLSVTQLLQRDVKAWVC